jgi:hypothetical protein
MARRTTSLTAISATHRTNTPRGPARHVRHCGKSPCRLSMVRPSRNKASRAAAMRSHASQQHSSKRKWWVPSSNSATICLHHACDGSLRCGGGLPPSPPAEKATARKDQSGSPAPAMWDGIGAGFLINSQKHRAAAFSGYLDDARPLSRGRFIWQICFYEEEDVLGLISSLVSQIHQLGFKLSRH